jgi:hypothetical protein
LPASRPRLKASTFSCDIPPGVSRKELKARGLR